jgi:hypothetical protein
MLAPQRPYPADAYQPAILDHYRLVGPLIEASFGGDPIVYANYPSGFDQPRLFGITDVPLSASKLLWAIHAKFAVEFLGWAPLPGDPDRLRFARIIMKLPSDKSFARLCTGAARMREHLREDGVDAAVLVESHDVIALWVPLADAPHAAVVRAWLHRLCDRAVAADPRLFTTEKNAVKPNRIHLHVGSNARRRFSGLPYSLRGAPDLPVIMPVTWDELAGFRPHAMTAATFPARLAERGDVFAAELKRIGTQRLPVAAPAMAVSPIDETVDSGPRGHIIGAALAILGDGKVRTADDILKEALARKLVPPNTTRKYIYTALSGYIGRCLGRGRKPQIVQDTARRFLINEPPDDWPDLVDLPAAEPDDALDGLIKRLESTSRGDDPEAFEFACCDALAHLGFLVTHLGGHAQPDGYADAELGVLGYRVMIECKTAEHAVTHPSAAQEAGKFLDAFHGDVAVLLGPDFFGWADILAELKTHRVTALSVPDLVTLLELRADPLELRAILVPGFADDAVNDLVWERRHGKLKRILTVAALVQREGWNAQHIAAAQHAAAAQHVRADAARLTVDAPRLNVDAPRLTVDAPRLTVDAAMLVVDAALAAAGSTQGCTREEIEAAFAHLTDPAIKAATWLDTAHTAIVILYAALSC